MFPVERLVLPFVALSIFWSWHLGIPLRSPEDLYFSRLGQCLAVYATGLCLAALAVRVELIRRHTPPPSFVETWAHFRHTYLKPYQLFSDFRFLNSIALMFFCFVQLKHFTPFINPSINDPWFDAVERDLFGGTLVAEQLQRILGLPAAPLISSGYLAFYPFMAFVLGYFILQRNIALAHRFVTAFAATWLLGALCIHLAPSWGPCFFAPDSIRQLPQTNVSLTQSDLWRHWLFVQANPQSPAGVFLISGFPSLHLAVPLLAMLFSFRRNQALFTVSTFFAAVTLLSTLYFAWHYLVDDLGSIALVLIAYGLSEILCQRYSPSRA